MNSIEISLRLIAGIGLILANAFFVAIEFALTRVRQYPESAFDEPGLRRAWEMTDDLEIYLTSCQVGISATSIAVGIVAEPALATLVSPLFENTTAASAGAGAVMAFVIINLLHLTHGEQTPTYLGVERTKFVAKYGATPLYWFAWLLSPVIWFGDAVAKWTLRRFGIEMTGAWLETETEIIETRADLRRKLGSLLEQGNLPKERQEEVLNALVVGEEQLRDAMTDIENVTFLSTDVPAEENLARIGSSPHTRFPLIESEPEAFVGIVYVPTVVDRIDDLREGTVTFADIATPPMTLPSELSLSDAIDHLQAEHQELALVTDDDEIVGLLTVTDALEALVGAFEDPLETGALPSEIVGDRRFRADD